jgi:phosphoribosylpyrophosphate synthetase
LELVLGTDSIDNPLAGAQAKISLISAAPVFAEAICRIHQNNSVSSLFEKIPDRVLTNSFRFLSTSHS